MFPTDVSPELHPAAGESTGLLCIPIFMYANS
uniref:Uncharacterized protein n=1 Tax=Anguilla anguilla TaxID=7936 RepID=A0A0E9QAD9_ANGAN